MKKRNIFISSLLAAVASVSLLTSCHIDKNGNNTTKIEETDVVTTKDENRTDSPMYKIYLLAKESDFTGTYEEWLESIKGDFIQLQVSNGNIEWKYSKDTTWKTLMSVSDLVQSKNVEFSSTSTHLVWKYSDEKEWKNLFDLSIFKDGKSAYEIAKDLGYEGTVEEWLFSLNGRGIKKIEKTKTVDNIDTYTITFTDDTTFEYNVTNGVSGDGSVIMPSEEDLANFEGFVLNQVVGLGYSVDYIYGDTSDVKIASKYANNDVVAINISKKIEKIEFSTNIKYIGNLNADNVYFDGTLEDFKKIQIDYMATPNNFYYKDGNEYVLLEEYEIGEDNSYASQLLANFCTILTIKESCNSVDLYECNCEEIYYDGTFEDLFASDLLEDFSWADDDIDYYFIDDNGKFEYNNKTYKHISAIDDIDIPLNAKGLKYLGKFYNLTSVTILDEQLFDDNYNLAEDLDYIYCDFDYNGECYNNIYVQTADPYYDIVHNEKFYISYSKAIISKYSNIKATINPVSFNDVKNEYKTHDQLDIYLSYNKKYGITASTQFTDPITNVSYVTGDILPTWRKISEDLNVVINQSAEYGYDDNANFSMFKNLETADNVYVDGKGEIIDIFANTTSNLNKLADDEKLVDLLPYINAGKMPALAKFLQDNPSVLDEFLFKGGLYCSPYYDGYQSIEESFIIDSSLVEKLLDEEIPSDLGNLTVGANAGEQSKGYNKEPKLTPFVGDEYYNYTDGNKTIKIVNPNSLKAEFVDVNQTSNIIADQNALINMGTTGRDLIEQFKSYAMEAYGDIIDKYYDGKISKMFTSVGACYNTDDMIALLRIFKANPDVLYGSSQIYDEVVPFFTRGKADLRLSDMLNFAATLYGVQGFGSENEKLFIGADGKLHSGDLQKAAFDMLENLHLMYEEGLMEEDFYYTNKANQTYGIDKFFTKKVEGSTFGLITYDYIGSTSKANDIYDGFGQKTGTRGVSSSGFDFDNIEVKGIIPILSPLTYVATESYDCNQDLNDQFGKTLNRYYEENRTAKNYSWAILKSSDNIESAIALFDYLFTEEGNRLMTFGPDDYYETDEFGITKFKEEVSNDLENTTLDYYYYCFSRLGSKFPLAYRDIESDVAYTNYYARKAYLDLLTACDEDVQLRSSAMNLDDANWNTSLPAMNTFGPVPSSVAEQYIPLENFFGSKNLAYVEPNNWIKVVLYGLEYDGYVAIDNNGNKYSLSAILQLVPIKSSTYLKYMGSFIDKVAPEAEN